MKRSRAGLPQAKPFAVSPGGWIEPFPQLARRWLGTDSAAWESARRPKPCLLSCNRQLQRIVAARLKQDWSPQQIAGWLKDQYPGHPEMWVSHETIYRQPFRSGSRALKKELLGHLRSRRRIRRPHRAIDGRTGERIIGAVPIRERPAEAEDRAVPGLICRVRRRQY